MMEREYFVLTFSKSIDVETVSEAIKALGAIFPEKNIIALPEEIHIKNYTKAELIELLDFYINYMKGLIDE